MDMGPNFSGIEGSTSEVEVTWDGIANNDDFIFKGLRRSFLGYEQFRDGLNELWVGFKDTFSHFEDMIRVLEEFRFRDEDLWGSWGRGFEVFFGVWVWVWR